MTRRGISAGFGSFSKTVSVLFSVLVIFCAASAGQAINEDLSPPKATAASSPARNKYPLKAAKKKSPPRVRRSTTASSPNGNYRETPDQIFSRYTNIRQSAGVTARDWRGVLFQSARNPNPSISRGQILLAQGHLSLAKRKPFDAINQFRAASQVMPTPVVYYSLGRAYMTNGQPKLAEDAFSRAVERDRNFALAYRGLGDAIAGQGDGKRAAKQFARANELGARVP